MDQVPLLQPTPQAEHPDRRYGHGRHEREALLERDLNDVYLLMDYLSGRSDRCISDLTLDNPTDPSKPLHLIDEVCKIRWPPPDNPMSRSAEASTLFRARDKLNQIASPANGATIAYTILVLAGGRGLKAWLATWLPFIQAPENAKSRADLAREAYPNLVPSANSFRAWITLLQFYLLGGLLLTCLLSWNVASGKLILQRIDQLDAQAVEIGRTLDAIELSATGGPTTDEGDSGVTTLTNLPAYERFCRRAAVAEKAAGTAMTDVIIRRREICSTARLVLQRRAIADRDLDEWTSYWGWLRHAAARFQGIEPAVYAAAPLGQPSPSMSAEAARGMAGEQWAADLMTVLGNFVLPMFYGFLGATTAVVLSIQNKLRESLLSPREKRMTQVQLGLGIIVGACIGLFLSPSSPDAAATAAGAGGAVTAGGSVALSASALSFLAGFGVESVFKMLQNMLQAIFGGQATAQPTTAQSPPPQHGAR